MKIIKISRIYCEDLLYFYILDVILIDLFTNYVILLSFCMYYTTITLSRFQGLKTFSTDIFLDTLVTEEKGMYIVMSKNIRYK